MDLRLDPMQEQLRDAVDAVLTRTGDPSAELATIGVPSLGAPERFGGLALGLSADVVVNDRLGHGLEPLGCYRATAFALDLLDADDVPTEHLADVVAELHKGTAHAVVVGAHAPPTVTTTADGALHGRSELLPRGTVGLCLVRAGRADGGTEWRLVLPDGVRCRAEQVEHLGLPATRMHFDGALGSPVPMTDRRREHALAAARIRQAAVLLGMGRRIVDVARAHVNARIQSGTPLAQRQTVAHRLARLLGEGDGWHLVLHRTAWEFDRGRPASAVSALAVAADHARAASRVGLQLHGVRGMLRQSVAAAAYRTIAVESVRMGRPVDLWREAGATA